jgi:hypothetical protein
VCPPCPFCTWTTSTVPSSTSAATTMSTTTLSSGMRHRFRTQASCKPMPCVQQPCLVEQCPIRYWPCPKATACSPCPDLAHLWLRFEALLRQNRIAFIPAEPLTMSETASTSSGSTSSSAATSSFSEDSNSAALIQAEGILSLFLK